MGLSESRLAGGFGQQILGDTWIAHYGKFQKEATLAHKNMVQKDHPVLRGVADTLFCRSDVNSVERLTPNETVLFHGQVLSGLSPNDPPSPTVAKKRVCRLPGSNRIPPPPALKGNRLLRPLDRRSIGKAKT